MSHHTGIKVTIEIPSTDGKTKQVITGYAMQLNVTRELDAIYSMDGTRTGMRPNPRTIHKLDVIQDSVKTVEIRQRMTKNRFKNILEDDK